MRKDFRLEILQSFLIVSSTTTVGKIYNNRWILDTVRLRWWFNDLLLPDPVRKATSSRSSFRYMASPPPFISFIGPLGWLQGNERLENFFSHFINWQACQELISLIVFEHQPFLVHPEDHFGLFQVHLVRPAHLWSLTTSTDQICNWKIISDSSSCLFSLSTETTWSKSHSLTSTDRDQLGPNLKNNLGLGLFVRESALVLLVKLVGAPRTAAADF